MTWQPSASLAALKARATLNRLIRDFFASRDVLEVETPLLCRSTATDPHLRSFAVPAGRDTLYLQTSPEFCMKRLLAAGSGPIYQLGKAFRYEESGRLHNPEFTLLEWYRPGWRLEQLVDEVEALVLAAAAAFARPLAPFPRITYQQAFENALGIDPHTATDQALLACANRHIDGDFVSLDRNGLLDLLMSHLVEPTLPTSGVFVLEFPASQAALAQKKQVSSGVWVARRAELYLAGMEIANGYQELLDPVEQRARFAEDLAYRREQGFECLPMPEELLQALEAGLPPSAGVALGVDRLLLAVTGQRRLADCLAFPWGGPNQ